MIFGIGRKGSAASSDNEATLVALSSQLGPMFKKIDVELAELRDEHISVASDVERFGAIVEFERSQHSQDIAPKWEFTQLSTTEPAFSYEHVTLLGREGWDMVSAMPFLLGTTIHTAWYFKRQLVELPDEKLAALGAQHERNVARLSELHERVNRLNEVRTQIISRVASELGDEAVSLLKGHYSADTPSS